MLRMIVWANTEGYSAHSERSASRFLINIGAHKHSGLQECLLKQLNVFEFPQFLVTKKTILPLPKCWRVSYRGKKLCSPPRREYWGGTHSTALSPFPESHRLPLLMKWKTSQVEDSTGLCSSLACLFASYWITWVHGTLLAYSALSSSIPTTHRSGSWQAWPSEMCWPQALSDDTY